ATVRERAEDRSLTVAARRRGGRPLPHGRGSSPAADRLNRLSPRPAPAVLLAEELLGLRLLRLGGSGVPVDGRGGAVVAVPQHARLGKGAAVVEAARRLAAGLARLDPLLVVADRLGDAHVRLDALEVLLRQQLVLRVAGQQHALGADEQGAVAP